MPNISIFKAKVWDGFDLNYVIATLLAPKEDLYMQKTLLMSAFGAWIAAPSNDLLRKTAIARTVGSILIHIERNGKKKLSNDSFLLYDFFERIQKPKIEEFYRDVYYAIGGMEAVIRKFSQHDFYKSFAKDSKYTRVTAEIVRIYHYNVTKSRVEDLRAPSLNKASDLILRISEPKRKSGMHVRTIKKAWSCGRPSAAFAYAAYNIDDINSSDLLQSIELGRFSWQRHRHRIPELVGKALYIQNCILTEAYRNGGAGTLIDGAGSIEKISFTEKKFDDKDAKTISNGFRRYASTRDMD